MKVTVNTGSISFRLLEQSASTVAESTDRLFVAMLIVCGVMAITLALLVLWFSIRYRAGSDANRDRPPSHAGGLEAAWTIAPLLLFLGLFVWAAHDAVQARRLDQKALPVYVVGKQWMWRIQHSSGRQEINELHVPVAQPVALIMASQDVIHSFFIPAFRLKQDVVPGRFTELMFTATELGEFPVYCTEYCGSAHSAMLARVVVMRADEYSRWAGEHAAQRDETWQMGRASYERLGCASCHSASSHVKAPLLQGLYGRRVQFDDGSSTIADDQYLRESILQPRRRLVAGQPPIMPSFEGQLDEEELLALVAYLRSPGASGADIDDPRAPGSASR